jgi:plastocyanin
MRILLPYTRAAIVATALFSLPVYAYDVKAVSDGGTVEGTVTYRGEVPMKKIIPTKDRDVCGGSREEPRIRVDANGAVESAVVYLVDVKAGKAWPEQSKPPVLDNVECRFEPEVQVIQAGRLDVVNKDPVLHNTHGYYGKRTAFNLALPNEGQTIPVDLNRAGTVRVDCDAHGWMEGWVYVVENPYYAVPAPWQIQITRSARQYKRVTVQHPPVYGMPVGNGKSAHKHGIELKQ